MNQKIERGRRRRDARRRCIGIDVGTEAIKLVELCEGAVSRWEVVEHDKDPVAKLLPLLSAWDVESASSVCVVGRASRLLALARAPQKEVQAAAFRFLHGDAPGTVVSIGAHGFSVLELRESGVDVFRENSRCSQGTGNFLRQLVDRFGLTIEEASRSCESVATPAPLSGRCPVILKTDMTHLANKGEPRERILAGLYDAVCENVQVLLKPGVSPARVMFTGGVSRSLRVRENFERFLEARNMELLPYSERDALIADALGAAVIAERQRMTPPPLAKMLERREEARIDRVPALSSALSRVTRMAPSAGAPASGNLVLGFDIGSTGSKLVALDRDTRQTVWEGYVRTEGDPVRAAQNLMRQLVESPAGGQPVQALGATGSGREIVGSMLATCFGVERVYVLNEIAAHAEGALHHDPRVDTIFEIGGQDAKYIRLSEGRVVDAAMNEACSAGTGSFIEEQGKRFSGIENVVQLGQEALDAEQGVSLGQHCSVFMAEIIDEAMTAGVERRAVVAGIYDSIVQNYLNRVKGARSVGQVVFCQGMPFASDALAAAVARQTGSEVIVPPNPGTIGALGIALLTLRAIPEELPATLDPKRFLEAEVTRRDSFVCQSAKGCGAPGNRCRIDRIATLTADKTQRFTWGGSCSLWDKGTGKKKLPDLAPDPIREREALVQRIVDRVTPRRGRATVSMTDEFQLKELFPFFATFISELGFDIVYQKSTGQKTLKRGIEKANVPFCAPMQLYHGLVATMAEGDSDYLFVPMLREMPRSSSEPHAVACPIVQASPDILRHDLGARPERLLSPVLDFGEDDLDSVELMQSCRRVAALLGKPGWWPAFERAREAQSVFRAECGRIGERALRFCRENDLIAVVVLGRPYTIYNSVLSSNVPPLLREQGAMPIPIDCYPVSDSVPVIEGVYWGHGQRNLRAAHQIRRTPGVYGIWCSNYSCGPDSFNLQFFSHAMAGKPFAVIETDGHSGDAGTKTRIEAFLHCVRQDLADAGSSSSQNELTEVARRHHTLADIRRRGEIVLFPRMGDGAETVAACLRGIGVRAECLPLADRRSLNLGRRHTSGKECVPMCITLGSLLARLESEQDSSARFAFFMPTADGPCRFGVYNILHRIVLERLGWQDRVEIWSPQDSDYFSGLPGGFAALVVIGFAAFDALQQALFDVRPVEREKGAAIRIFERYERALLSRLEQAGSEDSSLPRALLEVAGGRLFGCAEILRSASREFSSLKTDRVLPTVAVVGEIYVRLDPFASDFIVDKLERNGLRVRFAPFTEWLEYTDHVSRQRGQAGSFAARLESAVRRRIQNRCYQIMADELGWSPRTTVQDAVRAASPYVRDDLAGEAVLTVGGPVHEWRAGHIDGVVSVGPLECMPNKIAEAQFFHVAEKEGLPSLTIPVNGDGVDAALVEGFAFEVRSRFEGKARANRSDRGQQKRSDRDFATMDV